MNNLDFLPELNMHLMHVFNPLYIIPILAVILCAILVYALGFKSPVPPPSFEGIEEKKNIKKKREKGTKKEKSVQIENVNGSTTAKKVAPVKKKETNEEQTVAKKENIVEKLNVEKPQSGKKAKKARLKNEKLLEKKTLPQEKIETSPHEDLSEDGWVKLAKKEKKTKKPVTLKGKKEPVQVQYVPSVLSYDRSEDKTDLSKTELPRKDNKVSRDQISTKSKKESAATKDAQNVSQHLKDYNSIDAPKYDTPLPRHNRDFISSSSEERSSRNSSSDSEHLKGLKKKKKKQVPKELDEMINELIETENMPKSVAQSSPVQVISETPTVQDVSELQFSKLGNVQDNANVKDTVEKDQPCEQKAANVAFDELSGLYPVTKETKKSKKKLRREH